MAVQFISLFLYFSLLQFHYSQQDQKSHGLKNFNHTPPKQHYTTKNTYSSAIATKNPEPPHVEDDHYMKDSSYQQTTQYYNDQNNRVQNQIDRNVYSNYNGGKTNHVNHSQTEYNSNKQNVQYDQSKRNNLSDYKNHFKDSRDVKNVPESHERQIYNQYNPVEYTNHGDMYKQDFYNNSRDVYQNAEVYLQPEYANQEYMREKYNNPVYNNYPADEQNFSTHHYKNDNEYYQNYSQLECPNVLRRSLQDITHKSTALYENASAFQDDYRARELSRQQKPIPAGGRSMPNLKDIKQRVAISQQQLAKSR